MPQTTGEMIRATAAVVTPNLDLSPFIGVRVRITRTLRGTRYTYFGVFESLSHSDGTWCRGLPHCGGMLAEEPHGTCRGGVTGFDLPYGDATLELAPEVA